MTIDREAVLDDAVRAIEKRLGREVTGRELRRFRLALPLILAAEGEHIGPVVAAVRVLRTVRLALVSWIP